ncbi:U32 family peptidase [Bradyrhizobium sp. Y36]|uniref:ubiquinone anaerobic biosynthesis protein UbiV n=1 Tax=Bradyrhizobium sp. Y36 TaxID=2035447 RepID=UPI000BEA67D9|nr:U32 family peptidase [Bradyrhizobium sp. Y36]PDT88719.1 U32 family peptidase [Bradyrhizobium sp. Y36]
MQLSLGPVLYNWAPERWRDFYFRIADEAPVDVVSVGEIVCSKRSPFFADHIPAVVERLQSAGKQVLLGSLILVSLRRERRQTEELAAVEGAMVEVNDLTCLRALAGRPHAIGPFVNIYNEASAAFHAAHGAKRICLPPELPLASVATIAKAIPDVTTEVFAFGRVPLAISARCYHARLHKLAKDNCRFVCEKDPDGLLLNTLEQQDFLTINGVQTLSHTCANLLGDAGILRESKVGSLRLSPQDCDMVEIARIFRDVLDGRDDADGGNRRLAAVYAGVPFSNGFLWAEPGHLYRRGRSGDMQSVAPQIGPV